MGIFGGPQDVPMSDDLEFLSVSSGCFLNFRADDSVEG